MKKFVIFSTLVIFLVVSFASAEELTINSYMSDPVPKEALAILVEEFKTENPDIEVKLSTVDHEGFKTAVRTWLVSDDPPDIITWFAGERANFFISKGLILDITDIWEEAGWMEQFPKAFQSISFFDGKAYFLPSNWYWWGIFYRKSIFEKHSLQEPTTWEEFLQVCETLKSNGVTPITIGTRYRWTAAGWFDYLNLRVNGQEFHMGLMAGKEKYNDPRMLDVFTYWRQLLDKGYFLENAASYSWQEALTPLEQGEAAMYLIGQFIFDNVSEGVQGDLDFFQFPVIKPDVPLAEDTPTDGYMIPKDAKHPEAAKKFLKFLGSEKGQQIWIEKTGRIGVNTGVPMDLYPPLTQKGIKMIQGTAALAQFYDRDTDPAMADEGMNGFMEFWARPDNIEKILDRLEKERVRAFE